MGNKNTALGTHHETTVKMWLREHGWPYADRKAKNGSLDLGDLRLSERIPFVIEAKSSRSTTEKAALSTFIKELEAEVVNDHAAAGAVVIKKRGTTDVGEYYALMPVKYLNHLLERAYGEQVQEPMVVKRVVGRRIISQTIPPS